MQWRRHGGGGANAPPPPYDIYIYIFFFFFFFFFFCLSAQRSVMAMIIPLRHYDFFLEIFLKLEKKKCRRSPPLSDFFRGHFIKRLLSALSQSDARISVAYNSCQWKTLTKRLMKCPPGLAQNFWDRAAV